MIPVNLYQRVHHKLMQATNQCTLMGIHKCVEQNALRTGGKELCILKGNLLLLQDHPEGHTKIPDCFKDQ